MSKTKKKLTVQSTLKKKWTVESRSNKNLTVESKPNQKWTVDSVESNLKKKETVESRPKKKKFVKSKPKKKGSVEEDMSHFFKDSTPVYFIDQNTKRDTPAYFPESGFACKVRWDDPKFAKDWSMDGYVWRVNGSRKSVEYKGGHVFKTYFKLRIDHGEHGKAFTMEFNKRAYAHPDYENEILIIYEGDKSAVNVDYYNGNAKSQQKKEKPYIPTVPSAILTAKERMNEPPSKVHKDIINSAPQDIKRQACEATREVEQVRNAQRVARRAQMISHDAQYNVYELGTDADFLDGFQLTPDLVIVSIHKESLAEFRKLLNRSDVPCMLVEYDTTFNLGNFFMSWVTYRFTEFLDLPTCPMPTVGLACLIHKTKLQAVHEYFWDRLNKEIPEFNGASNVLLCTDEETSIVNAIRKAMPDIPRVRCYIHTWKDMKIKLRQLGIFEKKQLRTYRDDFYQLLYLGDYKEYLAAFRTLTRRSWNLEFSKYFELNIHPDIRNMGMWALSDYSVHHLLSTNRIESFNATLKREFPKKRGYAEDEILMGGFDIVTSQIQRVNRARYGIGERWLLRPQLRSQYSLHKDDGRISYNPNEPTIEEGSLSKRLDDAKDFHVNTDKMQKKGTVKPYLPSITAAERAQRTIDLDHITAVPKQQGWLVRSLCGKRLHAVTLFGLTGLPSHCCSCPATVTCYHILAAMKSIRYQYRASMHKRPNGTRFRQNLLKKGNARSGTKKGRQIDSDYGVKRNTTVEDDVTDFRQMLTNDQIEEENEMLEDEDNFQKGKIDQKKVGDVSQEEESNFDITGIDSEDSTHYDTKCVKMDADKRANFESASLTPDQEESVELKADEDLLQEKASDLIKNLTAAKKSEKSMDINRELVSNSDVDESVTRSPHLTPYLSLNTSKSLTNEKKNESEAVFRSNVRDERQQEKTLGILKELVTVKKDDFKLPPSKKLDLLIEKENVQPDNSKEAIHTKKTIWDKSKQNKKMVIDVDESVAASTHVTLDFSQFKKEKPLTYGKKLAAAPVSLSHDDFVVSKRKSDSKHDEVTHPNKKFKDSEEDALIPAVEPIDEELTVNKDFSLETPEVSFLLSKKSNMVLTVEMLYRADVLLKEDIEGCAFLEYRLKDSHMNAVHLMLRRKFRDIGGLMCVNYSPQANYPQPKQGKLLQFVHSPDHWVVLARGFFDSKSVVVYDSMPFSVKGRQQVLAVMSSLVRTREPSMDYKVATCQRQAGGSNDCGVLAIAFATSLAFGEDPTDRVYESQSIRAHLKACFQRNELTLFPSKPKNVTLKITMRSIKVYCHCRRTDYVDARVIQKDSSWDMVQCDKCKDYFHRMCDDFPQNTKLDWFCRSCK